MSTRYLSVLHMTALCRQCLPCLPCCAASSHRGGAESPVNCLPEVAPGMCIIWLEPYEPSSSGTSGGVFEVPHTHSGGEWQSTTPRSLPEFTLPLFPVQPSNGNGPASSSLRGKPDLMSNLVNSSHISDL